MAIELTDILKITDTTSLKDFRDKIAELREEISKLKLEGKDYTEQAQKIDVVQKHLNDVMTSSKKYTTDAEGSFNALNAQLRRLKEEWKATGDAAERARLGEEVNKVKAQMNSMNESIGNYQHNVGNYTNSIVAAFKQMGVSFGGASTKFASMAGMMIGGLGKLGAAFKSLWATMAANPIGVVLVAVGALIGAVSALSNAINDNEDSQRRMHEAMSAFKPLKDKFKNWLDQLAQGFVTLVEALADAYEWLRKTYAAYTDWMGATEGQKEKVEAEQAYARSLAQRENRLIDIQRETKRLNTTDEEQISLLREEASMTDDVTERTKLLIQARDLQKGVNERNMRLAIEEREVLKMQTATTANSIEVNNKLEEAENKVISVANQGRMAMLRLNRQITQGTKTTQTHTKAVDENAKALEKQREAMLKAAEAEQAEAEKIYKESVEALKTQTEKEEEEYQRRRQLLIDHNLDTEALDEAHRQKQIDELVKQQEQEYNLLEQQLDNEYALRERQLRQENEPESGAKNGTVARAMEEADAADAELERYRAYVEEKIRLNELEALLYEEGSEERMRIENENANLRLDLMDKEQKAFEKHDAAQKKLLKARESAYKSMASGTSNILKDLSGVMGENTKASKGFAIAAATIDTIAAAVAGFRAGFNQWKDNVPWMAPVQAALNATMALTAGFAEVQKIRSVDPNGNGGGGGGATALAIPNIEGLASPVDYTRQVTTETEREEMNRDNRVYILESDIQDSGRRVRVREEETTF